MIASEVRSMAAKLRLAMGTTPVAQAAPLLRALERWRQVALRHVLEGPGRSREGMAMHSRRGKFGGGRPLHPGGRRVEVMQWGAAASRALLRALGPMAERGVLLSRAFGQWQVGVTAALCRFSCSGV